MKTNVMLFLALASVSLASEASYGSYGDDSQNASQPAPSQAPSAPSTVPGFSKAAGFPSFVPTRPSFVPTGPNNKGLAPADFGKSLLTGILGLPSFISLDLALDAKKAQAQSIVVSLGQKLPAAGVPLTVSIVGEIENLITKILSLDVKLEVDATVEFVLLYLGVVVDGVKSIPAYIPGPNDKALGQADFSRSLLSGILGLPTFQAINAGNDAKQADAESIVKLLSAKIQASGLSITVELVAEIEDLVSTLLGLGVKLDVNAVVEFVLLRLGVSIGGLTTATPSVVSSGVPSGAPVSQASFSKSLLEGILGLPAFVALNLGDNATPQAQALVNLLSVNIQAAGISISVELAAHIEDLLANILVPGIKLDVNVVAQSILLQLGVAVGGAATPAIPSGAPVSQADFSKSLLEGILGLPAFVALNLGSNADAQAQELVNLLSVKLQAAGIAISVELAAHIEGLLGLFLIPGIKLDVDVAVDFILVQLGVAIGGSATPAIPSGAPVSQPDFSKSLLNGILGLPAFKALNLGNNATPQAQALVNAIVAKIQAAGITISLDLAVHIQALLLKLLVPGVQLDVNVAAESILVQLGVTVGGSTAAVPAPRFVPTGAPISQADFSRSLLSGILGLPAFISLELGNGAQSDAEEIVKLLAAKIQVAGIAITVDLVAEIEILLTKVLALAVKANVLDVNIAVDFVLLQLGIAVDVSVAIPSFVPAYIPGPNDKAISASDFPKSLQEGILALPAFIALNLGDKAQPDADAIATGIAAKVQAAGLKITVELVAEIQVLLTKILVAGVSLDVDATIQFVLVQLGVVVGAGKDNALSALPSSPTGSSSLIKAGNRKGDDSDDEDSDAEDSDDEDDSKGLDVEVDFSAKLSAVSLDAHVFVDLFGSKSSEVVHTLSSTIAATLSLKGLLSSTDPSALAAAINANIDVDLSHGHGSRVAEIVAAVKAAGLSIGIQADVAALLSADIEVALHGLGLDVDVSADVTLFKHDLVSALVGFRGMTQLFAGLDVDVNVALGAVVDELAAWLQANVNVHAELHLDAELSAKLAVLVKNAIRKGRFSRNRPSRIELSVVISEIVVDAVVALGLNVQVDGLRVDVKAALEAVIAA